MNNVTEMSSSAPRRLTFNFPALRHYFDNPDKSGVSVKIDGNTVFIMPVWHTGGPNALELVQRGEHGRQIILEGGLANQMTDAFLASGDTAIHPFFVIKPAKGGWLRLEHHTEDDAPKLVPHVRLWMPKTVEPGLPRMMVANVPPDIQPMLTDFVVHISECQEKVRIFESQRRAGRPPRDVLDAKFVLTSFVRLASGIPPELQAATAA